MSAVPGRFPHAALMIVSFLPFASQLLAQEPPSSPHAPRLQPTPKATWEMGIRVTSEGGGARGIVATFPLPVDWPEQQVTKLDESASDNVGRVSSRLLDEAVELVTVAIPRLEAGETAEVIVRLEIEKSLIEVPAATADLQFATRLNRDVREQILPSPFIESRDRRYQQLSAELFDDQRPAWDQIEGVFDWVREHVRYEFDETIRSSLTALDRGEGDCEELSSVFIAICRAHGIPARAVWVPGHTYPEFYLEDDEGNGYWYPCQIAGEGHDFGRMIETRPVLQKGDRFRLPGIREPQRYVRPTLTARDATGTPRIEWILRPVEPPNVP